MYEKIGIPGHLRRGRAGARVARYHDAPAGTGWAHKYRWLDAPAVRQCHGVSSVDLAPEWTFGNPHLARLVRIESSLSRFLHEGVAE